MDRPDPSPFSFVGGDYNLKPGSPALNAGNTALNASTVDIANSPRVVGTAIDMGAYEFQQTSLPVNLIIFNGSVQDGNATMRWQTGDETGLSRFELEKSSDGAIFSGVATITAKGSNNDYGYSLLQMEARAYYRLKMVEDNGKYRYSDILRLAQSLQNKTLVYPSPATDHVNIQSSVEGRLYIFDAQGKLVIQQMCKKGINLIDVSGLSEGIYYLQLGEKRMHFVKK